MFFSLLPAYAATLSGGALVALISGRYEIWIAGVSVLAGLVIVAVAHRNRTEQVHGRMIRSYALGFLTPFVLLTVFGAGMVTF